MKRLLFLLMIPIVLFGCKKGDPDPDPEIVAIVGKWKVVAYEKTLNGEKVWENVPVGNDPNYLSFRFDGVMLDAKGLSMCCAPAGYNLNGSLFEVKPKTNVPHNPQCNLVDCIGCKTWDLEQQGDELIVGFCSPVITRIKYVRV